MKILLIRFFSCLLISASFVSGISARSLARDLAYSEFHHAAFMSNCLDFEPNHAANKLQSNTVPATNPLDHLTSNFALLTSLQDSVLQSLRLSHIPSAILSALHNPNNGSAAPTSTQSLVVNRPEAGRPPVPAVAVVAAGNSQLAKRSLAKWQFQEAYRPYDLAVRDWKFGQFSQDVFAQAVQTTEAISKISLVSPNRALAQLADFLYQMENLQCQASAEIKTLRCVATWSQTAVHSVFKMQGDLVALTTKCLQCVEPNAPLHPYFSQPMLVAYQTSDGKQFVFTMEQARQWGLVGSFREFMPQPEKIDVTPQSIPNNFYAALMARISDYKRQAVRLTRWLTDLRIASTVDTADLH